MPPTDPHFIVTSKYQQQRTASARWDLGEPSARDNSGGAAGINAKVQTIAIRAVQLGGGVHPASMGGSSHRIL
jgi:hypothetical protein